MSDAELFHAIESGDVDTVEALLERDPARAEARNEEGLSAVLAAQYRHRHEIVSALLAAGPTLDVFEAAAVGDLARLEQLLEADPSLVDAYAGDGFYPLGLAAYFGQPAAVRLLLERGADVGTTARNPMEVQALHAAVAGRNGEAVRMLVAAGADVNARQHGGWTPLQGSAAHGDEEMVDLLLGHGADPSATNDSGKDAAALAAENGHDALAARLADRKPAQPVNG